jgi:hypothetical protein
MQNERLGKRALTYFPVWATALLWTVFYSEGAGFGAATYRNECVHRQLGGLCPLVYHALFPPHIAVSAFIGNVVSLWVDGIYDVGFLFAIIVCISLLLIASRMSRYVAERAFSWPAMVLGCICFGFIGYFYEIHQTLNTGEARVPML